MIKRLIVAATAVLLLMATPLAKPETLRVPWLQRTDGAAICTTFAINEDQHLWMTAAHCLVDDVMIGGDPADVVEVDEENDLAVLHTASVAAKGYALQRGPVEVGEPVMVVGYPIAIAVTSLAVFQGTVAAPLARIEQGPLRTLFDITSCGGDSGSPVFNLQGELVSVMQKAVGQPCGRPSAGATLDALKALKRYFH